MVTRTEGRDVYWLREAQRVHGKPPLPVFLTRLEDDQAGRQWIHPPSTVLAWHIVRKSGRLSSLGDCEQLYNRVLSLASLCVLSGTGRSIIGQIGVGIAQIKFRDFWKKRQEQ